MDTSRRLVRFGLLLFCIGLLSACATQPEIRGYGAPGFLMGLFHGAMAPFSFVAGLIIDGPRIYAFPNNGSWYDFGFLIGLSVWVGGATQT